MQSELGNFAGAIESSQQARTIFERLGLERTTMYATVLMSLAEYQLQQGSFEQAMDDAQHGLSLRKELLPPDHPDIADAFEDLSRVLLKLGRVEEAREAGMLCRELIRRSQCAGPGCELRLRPDGAPLDVCVKCRRTFYCGKTCQTADWKREEGHKAECKRLIPIDVMKSRRSASGYQEGHQAAHRGGGGQVNRYLLMK